MKIVLRSLDIKNFKGIKDQSINFSDKITNILGANHTGKTTTADAIHWVLFGKNYEGQTQFGIDPKDDENNIIYHLENEVSLTLTADNRELTLRKVRKEIWNKPKGVDEEMLTGHTVNYFINGNKYTAKEYQEEINALCSEALFGAITNPSYFPKLKTDAQRALLVKMAGDVSIDEIVKQNNEFKAFVDQLGGESLKRFREHLSYKMKEIKSELANIPTRIAENEQMLQELMSFGADFTSIRKRILEIEDAIKQYDEQLQDVSAKISQDYEKKATLRKHINNLKTELQDIEYKIRVANKKARNEHEDELARLRHRLREAERSRDMYADSLTRKKQALQNIELAIENFRQKWEEVENRSFEWDEEKEICSLCGQRLPTENIEELKEAALANWKERRMAEQDRLDAEAMSLKQRKQNADAEITDCQNKINDLTNDVRSIEKQLKDCESIIVNEVNYIEDVDWIRLNGQIRQEQDVLNNEGVNDEQTNTIQIINEKKQELIKQRDELKQSLAKENLIEERKERISVLEKEMRNLNQQLTDLERQEFLADNIEKASILDLENRVNKLFTLIRFKMFETLLNGSTKPACELTMHGVPYNDLSNSEKINAGIDLIRAMNVYNDMYAPIIIDNAESCNDILPTSSQQIRLIVSQDSRLTIVNE